MRSLSVNLLASSLYSSSLAHTHKTYSYEMLFGRTPFHGLDRDDTFDNILSSALTFPSDIPVSRECQELIQGLLTRNPNKRLGAHGGAEEIKNHPFFKPINWALLRNQRPPFVPRPGMQELPWSTS